MTAQTKRALYVKPVLVWYLSLQAELAARVEKMRQSILEGLNFARPPHLPPFPPPPPLPPHGMPFYPPTGYFYNPPPMTPPAGRGWGVPGEFCSLKHVAQIKVISHKSSETKCGLNIWCQLLAVSVRIRSSPNTRWEAGDRRHCGGSVVWYTTQPRKRRHPSAGGVCRWTKQRVTAERSNVSLILLWEQTFPSFTLHEQTKKTPLSSFYHCRKWDSVIHISIIAPIVK